MKQPTAQRINSRLTFDKHVLPHFKDGMKVLEVGPEKKGSTYRTRIDEEVNYFTADIRVPMGIHSGAIACSETQIDAVDCSFDIVFACNVLEHVRRPWLWVPELARITRPGGMVALVAPVTFGKHRCPYDCWRVLPDGARVLLEDAGLVAIFARLCNIHEDCQDLVAIGRVPE